MKNNLCRHLNLLLFGILCLPHPVFAQSNAPQTHGYALTNSDTFQDVTGMTVLVDKDYPFEQVLSDSTLLFVGNNDTLEPFANAVYWLKVSINNPFAYDETVKLACFPWIDFTVFYYDYAQKKWLNKRNGFSVVGSGRSWGSVPISLKSNQTSVFYFKTNVAALSKFGHTIRCGVSFRRARVAAEKAQFLDTMTATTIFAVLLFFLFNAYIYYIFRDKTYLYYLITQIGGIGYILTINHYLNSLLPFRLSRFDLDEFNRFGFMDLNQFGNRLSIILLLVGFIGLTRAYLNTPLLLPKQDKILKILLHTYIIVIVLCDLITLSGVKYLDYESSTVGNVLVLCTILAIFYTAFLSYRRAYPPARDFLFFNAVPLLVTLVLAVYFLFFADAYGGNMPQLANIAIIAQAFSLAVALVKRFLLIKEDLRKKELEAQELKAQNEKIAAENQFNKAELDSFTQSLREKNEAFEKLKEEIESKKNETNQHNWLVQINQTTILTDEQWRSFKLKFENVHTQFFVRLEQQIPNITEAEKRLMALTKLEVSNGDIAAMLGISPESVSKTRYRLKKKVGEEDLETLMERL